ncbi:MAG TPA: metallopeptidase family protein [Streptosporangiaceae bacterium]
MHDGNGIGRAAAGRVRRRDRHGRGLRGSLVPPEVPLHRTRSERFDDLVLLAVSQLEPRWEAELSGVEFGVEEIPPVIPDNDDPEPIPLARLEPGSGLPGDAVLPGDFGLSGDSGLPGSFGLPGSSGLPGDPEAVGHPAPDLSGPTDLVGLPDLPELTVRPARIVLYRRPLLARADGQEELAELILDVIVEQFAHWLGVDPQTVDPGYPTDE